MAAVNTWGGMPQQFQVNADPAKLEQFMGAMTGLSRGNFEAFAAQFDFSNFQTLCDVGGATGLLCLEVAKRQPRLRCISRFKRWCRVQTRVSLCVLAGASPSTPASKPIPRRSIFRIVIPPIA